MAEVLDKFSCSNAQCYIGALGIYPGLSDLLPEWDVLLVFVQRLLFLFVDIFLRDRWYSTHQSYSISWIE
jgi:hypothetical protein